MRLPSDAWGGEDGGPSLENRSDDAVSPHSCASRPTGRAKE
jgi:hypothetical protein